MKVFCIGDSSINVFLQIPSESDNVSIENSSRLMQFRLGSKTQLEKETVTVGGNALNVAVGLSRQGIDTELFSIIGDDADGDRILSFFGEEVKREKLKEKSYGLNLKIEKKENVKTNVGYAIGFKTERFLLIDTSPKNYELRITNYELRDGDWIFLSSIGSDYANTFRTLIEQKKSSNFRFAYNPSSNELKNPVETYVEMIKNSDILFVNKKEMEKIIVELLNCYIAKNTDDQISSPIDSPNNSSNFSSIQESIKKLWEVNRKIVVVTDGIRGSYAYNGQKIYFEPSCGEPAVEKTGAGDAYESGFLAEYIKSGNIQSAMRNGTENAASVIKYIGAVEGLQYKV